MCDASIAGERLEGVRPEVTRKNHLGYAMRWGYGYRMHSRSPVEGEVAVLHLVSQTMNEPDSSEWVLWLDCDALIANYSLPIQALMETYGFAGGAECTSASASSTCDAEDVMLAIAEEPNGINSGAFLVRNSSAGRRLMTAAVNSSWQMVGYQSMLLHQMALEADVFGEASCAASTAAESEGEAEREQDFSWAPRLLLLPQRALNLFTAEQAKRWTGELWESATWHPGDFILHLAGCPLRREDCWRRFVEAAAWIEVHNAS
eukprot:TRINITY_DN10831_c0_g1_i1.p1 TRINITY_DN10831_c0_g1~~TRINITY_DN10831_c0_g1_i1.p1  ORF type:complete len:261 (-),score=72.69 TRINITY_DN10831_c0_g1_i1:59-841(-)